MATKPTKKQQVPKRRDPIARDLLTPKYHQRVVPNKKRASKTGKFLLKNEALAD